MSIKKLGSRAIIGAYYAALDQYLGDSWIDAISMHFDSDQASEEYAWLGQAPTLREWIGGRLAKGLSTNGMTIKNLKFEATLELGADDLRRDKTKQTLIRVGDLADRTNSHWGSLLTQQILNGESVICYDGSAFFDTTHTEDGQPTQSNKLSLTLSTLGLTNYGTASAPSAEAMANVIFQAIQQIMGIKDNVGEPMNANARKFVVKVPLNLMAPALAAVKNPVFGGGATNTLSNLKEDGFEIKVVVNPSLTWTTKFSVFRADARVKPLIRQEELGVETSMLDENSDYYFDNDAFKLGVKTNRNVGFGYWQYACLVAMS